MLVGKKGSGLTNGHSEMGSGLRYCIIWKYRKRNYASLTL